MKNKDKKVELEEKLKKYESRLAKKKLGWGEATRTGSGHSYTDQLRDDCNALELVINSIKKELELLEK